MREFHHQCHRDLKPARIWGYDGMWPGPTLEVRSGKAITVNWINKLPSEHFLPIDYTLHGSGKDLPQVRAVVHVHGAQVMPASDGYPEAWFTSGGERGPSYVPGPYEYPNRQNAATLWYHDHAMGINRLNVYAGLSGFYLIRDASEDRLNLPTGAFDIPLMIQDRMFDADGSLVYPTEHYGTHPVWLQEFLGDVVCVNGKAAPYLEVEPRKYRFRLLNASNSRSYYMSLVTCGADGVPSKTSPVTPPIHQIGSDLGLLETPVNLSRVDLSPAERFEIVIDFSDYRGRYFALVNDPPAPSHGDREYNPRWKEPIPRDVLLFKVTKNLSSKDTSVLPDHLTTIAALNPTTAVRERLLSLKEVERPWDGYTVTSLLGDKRWSDPVTEDPRSGSTEVWSFLNTTHDIHPIHIHAVRFQVLNRQPFDWVPYLQHRSVAFTGAAIPPEENERKAWKDTVKAYPGMITRVIVKFDLPPGAHVPSGTRLRYVWHCHNLEHEDNEMMRPYELLV